MAAVARNKTDYISIGLNTLLTNSNLKTTWFSY